MIDGATSKSISGVNTVKNYVAPSHESEEHAAIVAHLITANLDSTNVNVKIYGIIGKHDEFNQADLARALNHAIADKAKIINISAGLSGPSLGVTKAIGNAKKHGIVIIAAAGNNYGGFADFPARINDVIAVGSKHKGEISDFSAEQGVNVWRDGQAVKYRGEVVAGTSFSAPKLTNQIVRQLQKQPLLGINHAKRVEEER